MPNEMSEVITEETEKCWKDLIASKEFPWLTEENSKPTRHADPRYNCIAWAAGSKYPLWWPKNGYWPPSVPGEENLACFIRAFETLGYRTCDDGAHEPG